MKNFDIDLSITPGIAKLIDPIYDYILKFGPVHSRELENKYMIRDNQVRSIISFLRVQGYAVCSSSKGYWLAATTKEVDDTIQHLSERMNAIAHVIKGLERSKKKMVQRAKQEQLFEAM